MDNLILEVTIWIDDEKTTQWDTFVFEQYTVIAANIFGDVGAEDVIQFAQSTFIFGGVDPGAVAVYAVGWDCEDFGAGALDVFQSVMKGFKFGWANKGEI
jgi:hypothetical protein